MKVMRLFLSWLIIIFACALLVAPLHAQEATPEPTEVAVEQPDPVTVVRDTSTALTELIAAFLAGGVIVGGGVIVALRSLIKVFNNNPALSAAIERLYLSQPPTTQQRVRPIVETGKELFTLLDDLTDGELRAVQAQTTALLAEKPKPN